MAINLQVSLTLDDRLSSQISRANQRIQQTQQQVNSLDQRLSSARAGINSASSSISNFGARGVGAVSSINTKFLGLLATIGATHLAMSGLSSIVKKSAEFERSQVTIGAIFDDKEASDAYTEMVKKVAVDSPILDSSAMFSNSLPFLTLTKDVDQLEDAWKLAEKLSIINPMQGVEGSVIAMKELASGDAVALSERFNISKKDLNDLKKLSFKEQVVGLDKLLSGMGITEKAVEEMGNTTAAQFVKVQEKWDNMLVEMGESSNSQIGNALRKFNEMLDDGKFDEVAAALDNTLGTIASKITTFVETADWDAISQNVISAFDSINNAIAWSIENWEQIKEVIKWVTIAFVAFKAVMIVASVLTAIASAVRVVISVFKLVWSVLKYVKTAFNLLRIAMLLLPTSWIVAAIGLIIGAFVLLWNKCEWFQDFWKTTWEFAVDSAEWGINNIIDGINWLIKAINSIPLINIGTVGGVDFNGDGNASGANSTTQSATKKQVNAVSSTKTLADIKKAQANTLIPPSQVKTAPVSKTVLPTPQVNTLVPPAQVKTVVQPGPVAKAAPTNTIVPAPQVRTIVENNTIAPASRAMPTQVDVTVPTPRVGDINVDAIMPTPKVGNINVDAVMPTPKIGDINVDAMMPTPKMGDINVDAIMPTPKMGDISVDAMMPTQKIGDINVDAIMPTQKIGDISVDAMMPTQTVGDTRVDAVIPAPQVKTIVQPSQVKNILPPTQENNTQINSVAYTPQFKVQPQSQSDSQSHSHSGGLSRIPYDGYQATLHRNERVLTNVEADKYERGANNNSSISISFAGANFNVRNESDIEAIANALATKINQSIIKGA